MVVLHEISHIMRRLKISVATILCLQQHLKKLLNGKYVKEVGNQLELLLFKSVIKSIEDLDAVYSLKQTGKKCIKCDRISKTIEK